MYSTKDGHVRQILLSQYAFCMSLLMQSVWYTVEVLYRLSDDVIFKQIAAYLIIFENALYFECQSGFQCQNKSTTITNDHASAMLAHLHRR